MRNRGSFWKDEKGESPEIKRHRLLEEFGLPHNTKFLFLKKRQNFTNPPIQLHFGTVVCFDEDTHELLLVVKFHPFKDTQQALLQQFERSISLLYLHAQARYPIKTNGAMKKAEPDFGGGKMCAIGFRPGYVRGIKAG